MKRKKGKRIYLGRNKKASMLDLFALIAVMFVIGLSIFLAFTVFGKITNSMDSYRTIPEVNTTFNAGEGALKTFDYGFAFFVIGLGLSAVIFASLVKTHPVFLIFAIIIYAIAIMLSAQISNVWQSNIQNATIFENATGNFPIVNKFFSKLPLIILGEGLMMIFALYMSYKSQWE